MQQGVAMGSNSGYSPVVSAVDGTFEVQLGDDHPGRSDPEYRERRNEIAALSSSYVPGGEIPAIEYTDREHDVWRTVATELTGKHDRYACREYLEASEELALPEDHIPQLGEVTARLQPLTGWRYEPVAGLAPLREFYGSFATGRFFSTQYIRHHSVPLYTPEPDIVHEVVGHANQLANRPFAEVCAEVGLATERTKSPEALAFLSHVFWFTLEFGVVYEAGEPRAYGAGILSSYGELDVFQSAEIRPLDFLEMGLASYDITRYQPVLYSAPSFDQLIETLHGFYSTYDDAAYTRLVAGVPAARLAG